ncbi:acyl-CoA dehydrogenase [Rhodoligotrophos appendicifer]|uniref:acyl-CoA dehydrogenase family protein n=1 Tax=Rhodoligotrophos appendicifer TaxID=987056 RepID=UPI00117EE910|nr:acyl-CoA dehydrogenase family protein [Rhodoligotrophos appendicifer]
MNDTARLLADTTTRFLARHTEQPGQAEGSDYWTELQDTGLTLAMADAEQGGIEASWSEAAVIAESWGFHAAPGPIVEILLASRFGGPHAGSATVAAIPLDPAAPLDAAWYEGATILLARRPDGDGFRLSAYPIAGLEPVADLAGPPRIFLEVNALPEALSLEDWPEELALGGGLLTAAAMLGAMERVQSIVIDHANTRQQFGRPLGKFQAIQFMIAEMASEITVTRAALTGALGLADAGACRSFDAAVVKAQAGRAATLVAAHAHQVLGAIGFTEEHMLHHFTKRLWMWRDDWGRQSAAAETVGRAAAAAGAGGLWPLIVGADIGAQEAAAG